MFRVDAFKRLMVATFQPLNPEPLDPEGITAPFLIFRIPHSAFQLPNS